MLRFTKMNGAGNDFVLIDNRSGAHQFSASQIAFLSDRHRGVGADGVLLVEPATSEADFRMRYYNSDGGEAEMCGNGARCFTRFVSKITGSLADIRFETQAGIVEAKTEAELVTLSLSRPQDLVLSRTLEIGETESRVGTLGSSPKRSPAGMPPGSECNPGRVVVLPLADDNRCLSGCFSSRPAPSRTSNTSAEAIARRRPDP